MPGQNMPLMVDLFSGTGGASAAFAQAGWNVLRIDNSPDAYHAVNRDMKEFQYTGAVRPTVIWASPPCTEFSREAMPWCRTGNAPSMELALATRRVLDLARPCWWVVENVHGALKYFEPVFGKARKYGPFYLWGNFPDFKLDVPPQKQRSHGRDAKGRARRAAVPYVLSEALYKAIVSASYTPTYYPMCPVEPPPPLKRRIL